MEIIYESKVFHLGPGGACFRFASAQGSDGAACGAADDVNERATVSDFLERPSPNCDYPQTPWRREGTAPIDILSEFPAPHRLGAMTQVAYDLENRLTCVLGTDGTCTSSTATLYLYDAAGQRVGKQQADTLEDYVYDPQGQITSVYQNGSASPFRAELYTPQGRHVATLNPGATGGPLFYNHADWLGTERVRTTPSGGFV